MSVGDCEEVGSVDADQVAVWERVVEVDGEMDRDGEAAMERLVLTV